MPGIADKQIVHDIGTTYYAQLIQGGVKYMNMNLVLCIQKSLFVTIHMPRSEQST